MYLLNSKHTPLYALLFRIFGFAVGLTAIILQLFTNAIIGKGFMANHVLAYFTIQTNIFTTLIFLYLIIKTIVVSIRARELKFVSLYKSLHLACTFYITITMSVYWAVLGPMVGVGGTALQICNTLFLHLFSPLCAIFECVLFFEHGSLNKKDAIKWLSYPLAYLILIIIIANTSDIPYYKFPMGDTVISLKYPYPFIDPQVVTLPGMIFIIIGLFFLCLGFGLLYIYVDRKIGEHLKKQTREINA